jgi:hypothetical protein
MTQRRHRLQADGVAVFLRSRAILVSLEASQDRP